LHIELFPKTKDTFKAYFPVEAKNSKVEVFLTFSSYLMLNQLKKTNNALHDFLVENKIYVFVNEFDSFKIKLIGWIYGKLPTTT
jgi:hypothetical protein